MLKEKRQHEKDFQDKKEAEERVESIGRRTSISRSPSPRINLERVEQNQGPKSEPPVSSPRSNTNQKLVPLAEKEVLETSSNSSEEEEHYGVSQKVINELFDEI